MAWIGKKKKRKIRLMGVLLAVMMLFASGCEWARELSEEFEEAEVQARAEDAMELLNACDFEAIEELVDEAFKDQLSAEILEEALGEKIQSLGEFDGYSDEAVVGLKSKDYDGNVAVAVLNGTYKNGTIAVTISYNTDYKIIGFYAK